MPKFELRSRPKPLLSAQFVTNWPSVYGVVSASNQSWSPSVTGGCVEGGGEDPDDTTVAVCAEDAVALPTVFVAVAATRIVKPMSAPVRL